MRGEERRDALPRRRVAERADGVHQADVAAENRDLRRERRPARGDERPCALAGRRLGEELREVNRRVLRADAIGQHPLQSAIDQRGIREVRQRVEITVSILG